MNGARKISQGRLPWRHAGAVACSRAVRFVCARNLVFGLSMLIGVLIAVIDLGPASAQSSGQPLGQPGQAPGAWSADTQVNRDAPAKPPVAPSSGWGEPGNLTVVPRSAGEAKAAAAVGQLSVTAVLIEDGAPIEEGIVWRAFQAEQSPQAAAGAKPRLVGTWREASPTLQLPPGDYLVNAAFGRAHLTRKLTLTAGATLKEQFVLNAGGIRITTVLAGGEPIPANAVGYDIYATDSDQQGARAKLVSSGKPGLIVRLNAGVYQVVSTYGDANSIVKADVTVDAGKLSEATITHQAAKVTFKLVTRPGGEAIADTQWTIQTPHGELVRESQGALPSHILAAGQYAVIAKNGGRIYKRSVTLEAGGPVQVEVVMQ